MDTQSDAPPHSLKYSNTNSKVKVIEEGVGVRSLARSTSRVNEHARASGWGIGRMTSGSTINTNLHQPNNKLVNA
jgi:hypothetical protein